MHLSRPRPSYLRPGYQRPKRHTCFPHGANQLYLPLPATWSVKGQANEENTSSSLCVSIMRSLWLCRQKSPWKTFKKIHDPVQNPDVQNEIKPHGLGTRQIRLSAFLLGYKKDITITTWKAPRTRPARSRISNLSNNLHEAPNLPNGLQELANNAKREANSQSIQSQQQRQRGEPQHIHFKQIQRRATSEYDIL